MCGGTLVTREDDTEEALAVRLRDYHEKTDPVLTIFGRKEYVLRIDATQDKEEVQKAIREALELPAFTPETVPPAVTPAAPVPRTPGRRTPAASGSRSRGS